jgi:hypothetical protein
MNQRQWEEAEPTVMLLVAAACHDLAWHGDHYDIPDVRDTAARMAEHLQGCDFSSCPLPEDACRHDWDWVLKHAEDRASPEDAALVKQWAAECV